MPTPEFIFLNDEAARVTSLRQDDTGGFTLVVIARGGADRDRTLELLNAADLSVRFNAGPARSMRTTGTEVRSAGDGPQAIHRIEATLTPATPEAPASPSEPILDRLDRIIELLVEIRRRMD